MDIGNGANLLTGCWCCNIYSR